MKDKRTALLLSVFLGVYGVDRFYLGYTKMGVIKLLTGGCFWILWIKDIIDIATGKLQPADGSGYVNKSQIRIGSARITSYLIWGISVFITVFALLVNEFEGAAILALVILVILFYIYVFGIDGPRKVKKAKEAKMKCRLEGDTLHVDEQSSAFSVILSFNEKKIKQYSYNPEKTHFGAVTVGGVTTGGVYKTGGNYSKSEHGAGRYELLYSPRKSVLFAEPPKAVKQIVIADSLKEKVENSPLKYCLKGNVITVVYDIDASKDERVRDLIRLGYTTEAVNFGKQLEMEGYPDKKKCMAISELLCGQ